MSDAPAACDRFEREGLLAIEQGRDLDPHFATCPDCQRARAAYEKVAATLATAGAGDEPSAQWQAGVWARIARRQEARDRRKWMSWLIPAGVVAAFFVALFLRLPATPELSIAVEPGAAVRRGSDAQPGDRLVLTATTGGAAHAELRVYRDDNELLLRCADEPPCARRGDHLRASLVLPAVGVYQPLLVVSEAPIPAPAASGSLDGDAATAMGRGARVELGDEVVVQ